MLKKKYFDKSQHKKITYISEESETQTQKLKTKLKECQKEKEEYLTQAQRARADLINFRRRQEEMKANLVAGLEITLMRDFLPILDSLKAGSGKDKGVKQILYQFERELIKREVKAIDALGEKFNPEIHEAVEKVESKEESGTIVEVIQTGYTMGNLVLRPSKVKVAK